MISRASLLGCGMRTALGFDRASSAAAVRAGIATIGEHPFMIDRFGAPMCVTRDAELAPEISGAARLAGLAVPALRAALAPIADQNATVSVLLNFGEDRPGLTPEIVSQTTKLIGAAISDDVKIDRIGSFRGGHAGGLVGIHSAIALIASGKSDMVLVGGVESYLDAGTLEWLDDIEQLHSDGNIYGFCPGEGAGFVLLGHPRHQGLGLDVVGAGTGAEKNLINTEDICLGEGLGDAFQAASETLPEAAKIDRIICDMNGQRYRGSEYGFAVLRTPDLFADAADFETPADCWGDVGAASGLLYAGLALEAEARGYAKGPLTMIWASSDAGRRAAIVLARREAG
jgi:3-oxoacyl-[acyl-carrier-protein] synthase-1